MRAFIVTIIGALCCLAVPCLGQEPEKTEEDTTSSSKCSFCPGGKHYSGSPYTINLKRELPFLGIGLASSTIGLVMRANRDRSLYTPLELAELDKSDINSFDRTAVDNRSQSAQDISDVLQFTTTVMPVIFLINHNTRQDIGPLLLMAFEVGTITIGATEITKHLVGRTRPFTYNQALSPAERNKGDVRASFFSGHTSFTAAFAFFTAKVISDYHPGAYRGVKIAAWATAITVPATTGLMRVLAGKHFPTDVITGYAVGGAIGFLVPHLHRKRAEKEATSDGGFSWTPSLLPGGSGLGMNMSYRF